MDHFKVSQGASLPIPLVTIRDSSGAAITTYDGTETLATEVWPGGNFPGDFTLTTTWVTPSAGTIQLASISAAQSAGLAVGRYEGLTRLTPSGSDPIDVYRFTVDVLPYAASAVVCTDLVEQDYLLAALRAGGLCLTTPQFEALTALTKSASRLIRRHCNRFFNRCGPRGVASGIPAYDGLYSIDWPSRTFLLRQYPLNAPPVVRTNPTVALTVWNTASTAVRAWVTMTTDGTVEDVDDVSPATTGLVLYSVAAGVTSNTAFTWSLYPTLTELAAAIGGVSGWQATVTDGYGGWPSSDFRAGQGSQPALGYQSQVGFSVMADDVPCLYDARRGTVTLAEQLNDPFTSPRFGMYLQTDLDDVTVYGGPQGIRVQYDAGWDVVPEDVQNACVETIADMLNRLSLDQNLGSESDGARSYVLNTAFANYALPKSVIGKLAPYRSPRA